MDESENENHKFLISDLIRDPENFIKTLIFQIKWKKVKCKKVIWKKMK